MRRTFLGGLLILAAVVQTAAQNGQAQRGTTKFVDHSLLVAPEYPCTWPAYPFPRFQITHQRTIFAMTKSASMGIARAGQNGRCRKTTSTAAPVRTRV